MKRLILTIMLLSLLLPSVLADQTLSLVVDIRDLPMRDTLEIPVIDLDEGDKVHVNTSSDWLDSRKTAYTVDETGETLVLIDVYIPYDAKEGDYVEKVIIWTYDVRIEITVKIKVAKTIKRSDITFEILDLFTSTTLEGAKINMYSEPMRNGTTDINGLVMFENVREGCKDAAVSFTGYRPAMIYMCSTGEDRRFTYYLLNDSKVNLTARDELLAYRNFLTEHENKIMSVYEVTDSFVITSEDNITCPRQADFDRVSSELETCNKTKEVWMGVADNTAYFNNEIANKELNTRQKLYWSAGALIIAGLIYISFMLLKKYGVIGTGGMSI